MQTEMLALQDEWCICFLAYFVIESHDSCFAGDGRAWKIDGRAQALVALGLAMPLKETLLLHNRLGDFEQYGLCKCL